MLTLHGQNGSETIMKIHGFQLIKFRNLLLLIIILASVSSACVPQTRSISPTETKTPTLIASETREPSLTSTPRPTATPTEAPLGGSANPITIGFILTPEQVEGIDAAEEITLFVAKTTGLVLESQIYPDFQSLSTAILNGDVHLFWLEPLQYIYLNWAGAAEVVLMTNHLGVYGYGVRFMANAFRGFTSYYDPETDQSYGNPLDALQQFSGTRPCLLNPDSLPGYYLPLGLLADTSTPTLDPVFTYSYTATIRALYIQGICDFGVSYALIGDPRTSTDIIQTIPEAQSQVITIWQSDGIIPNTNFAASPIIPLHYRYRIQEALLDLPNTPEGLSLLSTALDYEVAALKTVEDSVYNPLRAAIIPLELDLAAITQQQGNHDSD